MLQISNSKCQYIGHIKIFYTLELREDGFLTKTWITLNMIFSTWILLYIYQNTK